MLGYSACQIICATNALTTVAYRTGWFANMIWKIPVLVDQDTRAGFTCVYARQSVTIPKHIVNVVETYAPSVTMVVHVLPGLRDSWSGQLFIIL